jgi:hypothetical protein
MSVGTTVAIVAAMIVGYGGLVALIVSQSKSLRAELKGHIGKIDSKIDAVAQSLDGKISAVREEVYRVGKQVDHVEGRMDEISGIVRAAFGPRAGLLAQRSLYQ